ncbi:MAG: hypothetical protein H3C35_08475 [Bacteroidetes bacterium]|nr:hypothetical protein [Bacteroidota bacterium]
MKTPEQLQINHTSVKVELCNSCEGRGEVGNPRYLHGDYDAPETIPCTSCDAQGTIYKRSVITYLRRKEYFAASENKQ